MCASVVLSGAAQPSPRVAFGRKRPSSASPLLCRSVKRSTMRSTTKSVISAAIIVLAVAVPARSQNAGSKKPVVNAALVSSDQTVLFVQGVNLGPHPTVMLGDAALASIAVDASGAQLVANLPPLMPGTYLLTLAVGSWVTQFAVAVGDIGPAGPT